MPPAKSRVLNEDSRSEGSLSFREKQIAAAAHARSKKNGATSTALHNGSSLKETTLLSTESGNVIAPGQNIGMSWTTAPPKLLSTYRMAHSLSTPTAFTSPLNQALLTNPGIGRQSPTMARRREMRRVSKEQLALSVRKHFNGAAVNEIEVVVEFVYKVRNQGKAFRMRSTPSITKK